MENLELKNAYFQLDSWNCTFTGTFPGHQWTVICGASGSGKSTLLKMIMGLSTVTNGEISMNGESIIGLAPHLRCIGYMGQSNMLFPGINILENLALALEYSPFSRSEKNEKISEIICSLGLGTEILQRYPDQLSGGQLSRCNLARAILKADKWLLLDEPFAAIDRSTRMEILSWLKKWHKTKNLGILMVAHDLSDVFCVSSHIAVVDSGRLIELGPTKKVINAPQNLKTAQLLCSGIILKAEKPIQFIHASELALARSDLNCSESQIESISLTNPSILRSGHILRIIDLDMDCDVTIASPRDFSGSLWFDKSKCIPLC